MERLQKQPAMDIEGNFNPEPVNTNGFDLTEKLEVFVNKYSEQWHDTWSLERFANGWSYGTHYDEQVKHHPMLKPYRLFNDKV